jgi:hypothetical protein
MGMKDISMRRIILIVVGVAVLSLLLLVMWNEAWGPFRGWRIKRQKTLVGGIIMHIDDIELSPQTTGKDALRVRCRYTGGDPNKGNYLTASLLASPNGPELHCGIYGQAPAAPVGEAGIPMFWEFSKAPEHVAQFTMRIIVKPLATAQIQPAPQYNVDFTLPYLPRFEPSGDDYRP